MVYLLLPSAYSCKQLERWYLKWDNAYIQLICIDPKTSKKQAKIQLTVIIQYYKQLWQMSPTCWHKILYIWSVLLSMMLKNITRINCITEKKYDNEMTAWCVHIVTGYYWTQSTGSYAKTVDVLPNKKKDWPYVCVQTAQMKASPERVKGEW